MCSLGCCGKLRNMYGLYSQQALSLPGVGVWNERHTQTTTNTREHKQEKQDVHQLWKSEQALRKKRS